MGNETQTAAQTSRGMNCAKGVGAGRAAVSQSQGGKVWGDRSGLGMGEFHLVLSDVFRSYLR